MAGRPLHPEGSIQWPQYYCSPQCGSLAGTAPSDPAPPPGRVEEITLLGYPSDLAKTDLSLLALI